MIIYNSNTYDYSRTCIKRTSIKRLPFSKVPMNNFLLSSPLLIIGHFEKMYHTSATGPTVRGIKWSSTFFLGPRRGRNRWRSICRGINISLFDYLQFSWITLTFVKPVLKGQPVLSGQYAIPKYTSPITLH